MLSVGICIGCVLFGFVCGLSGAVFIAIGFNARGRADAGQSLLRPNKPLDPVVNTDPEFVDGIRQDRHEQGLDPYLNTD